MMIIPTFLSVFHFTWTVIYIAEINDYYIFYLAPFARLVESIYIGLLFRFVRVVAQLKASEENSKKVLASIQRSKKIEKFIYIDLLIYVLAMLSIYTC